MTKPDPTPAELEAQTFTVALEIFPEFAAQIGILISCFVFLESYVHVLLSRLTGTDQADAFIFVGTFNTFRQRIDLLDLLAKRRDPHSEAVVIAKHFVSILREAAEIRNRYAHAEYGLEHEGGYSPTAKKIMHIQTRAYDAKSNTRNVTKTLDELKAEVYRTKVIVCEIGAYVHRGIRPKLPA
jgi:hypothetical protein